MDEMTSLRERRTSGVWGSRRSVCFQLTPWSSSCMQMAFWMVSGCPRLVVRWPSKYLHG
jgi:hypothetical protein